MEIKFEHVNRFFHYSCSAQIGIGRPAEPKKRVIEIRGTDPRDLISGQQLQDILTETLKK